MLKGKFSILQARHWILLALAVKGLMFLFFVSEFGTVTLPGFFGTYGGDTPSYLDPVEKLISDGNYDPDFRMPGYGWIFFIFRLILSKAAACNALILLQYVLASVSVYLLALSARIIFKSDRIFYLVYFTFLISTYTSVCDVFLLTESLAVSSSIFFIYFFIIGMLEKRNKYLFVSGLFLTWIIFLRPVYLPYLIFGVLILMLFFYRNQVGYKKILASASIFLLPFCIIDSAWIYRNFEIYNRIIPLTKSKLYPGAEESYFSDMLKFLQSWGGNYVFWDPSAEIRWFGIREHRPGMAPLVDKNISIPDDIYTTQFNSDSLLLIKDMLGKLNSDSTTADDRIMLNASLKEKLSTYTLSVKNEKPFLFYIKSKVIYFKKFLMHSGTYNLYASPWESQNVFRKAVKLFYSFEYLFVLLTGIAGAFLILFWKRRLIQMIVPLITFYGVTIFPIVLMLPEMRYFIPTFPFLLVCSMWLVDLVVTKLLKAKSFSKEV